MTTRNTFKKTPDVQEECILALQGGGALGPYQAGVYEALAGAGHAPHWLAGISIGAINAALIAGNPPHQRVSRLREFWETVTSSPWQWAFAAPSTVQGQTALNNAHACMTTIFGQPGFFSPWPLALLAGLPSAGVVSIYDTLPLRTTLERLVDFDLLNSGRTRLSVGAVNIRTGNFSYFDTEKQVLDVRHIMASSALPPGFPPIEIDGEWYWDGGLVSNTPLQYILDQSSAACGLVFQVDLFVAEGQLPTNLMDVEERLKDIRFSSRTRLNTNDAMQRHALIQAVHGLIAKLPDALRDDPDVVALLKATQQQGATVVHLIYRGKHGDTHSKDYEFSRNSMRDHWQAGHADVLYTLAHPNWKQHPPHDDLVHVLDLTPKLMNA